MPLRYDPSRQELLDGLERVATVAEEMLARWQDGIPEDVRIEIADRIETVVIRLLIRAGRRR